MTDYSKFLYIGNFMVGDFDRLRLDYRSENVRTGPTLDSQLQLALPVTSMGAYVDSPKARGDSKGVSLEQALGMVETQGAVVEASRRVAIIANQRFLRTVY